MRSNLDLRFVGLSLPLLALGVFLMIQVDFSHTPRNEMLGTDVGALNEGCLDWWCRGPDVFLAALSAVLLIAAVAALLLGLRGQGR